MNPPLFFLLWLQWFLDEVRSLGWFGAEAAAVRDDATQGAAAAAAAAARAAERQAGQTAADLQSQQQQQQQQQGQLVGAAM